jgi:hypothetical protein
MTTAPSTLIALQDKLVSNLHTKNLGIVGDASHVASGGYHIGAKTLRRNGMSNDYSLEFALDRDATHDYACAIDIGGSASQLMTLGNRLVHALKNHDPRVYRRIRGVNAPFDGVSADRRYDTENPNTSSDDNTQSSSDRGHIHVEIYRTLVLKQSVMDGLYSVLAGRSPAPTPAPKPGTKIYQFHAVPDLIRKGSGQYLGLITGPSNSHGGFNASERPIIKMLQQRLIACRFVPGVTSTSSSWADGVFQKPTADAVTRFQRAHMPNTTRFGEVWWDDWTKLFNL